MFNSNAHILPGFPSQPCFIWGGSEGIPQIWTKPENHIFGYMTYPTCVDELGVKKCVFHSKQLYILVHIYII